VSPRSAVVKIPSTRYPIERFTLPNGLRVVLTPDRSAPVIGVAVVYDVGIRSEPEGRTGFAHLFEHLMFKATRDLPAESFDRLTEDVGGLNNASTFDDFTNYYEVVPANHLQRLLWAEAERMGTLVVDEANFKSERNVVEEELRQRVLASPEPRARAHGCPARQTPDRVATACTNPDRPQRLSTATVYSEMMINSATNYVVVAHLFAERAEDR